MSLAARLLCACSVAVGTLICLDAPSFAADSPPIRLYVLDGGHFSFKDMSSFSDTGDYDGKAGELAVSCFLIRHPKGTLMWDTGLNPGFAQRGEGEAYGVHATVGASLGQQLRQIGVAPADVTYVAFSHLHIDHSGNANLFSASTWIMNKAELAWATGPEGTRATDGSTFSAYKSAKTRLIEGDFDVFGDGTVRILKAPGHTPGHQVLLLHLRSGNVLLSGDLYHLRSDVAGHIVYAGNTDRAATLASFDRIDRIIRNTHARLIVQHDPQDIGSLPKFPAYLQ